MKLEFLGTGAADYNFSQDKELKEYRLYSSALIDDTLLIDPGPHIFQYIEQSNQPHLLDKLDYVIITHSHADHLNANSVRQILQIRPNTIFAGNAACKQIFFEADLLKNFQELMYMKEKKFGEFAVTPLPANHCLGENAMLFSITKHKKKLFYGTDTSWLPNQTWNYICQKEYDLFVYELTLGNVMLDRRIFEHTSLQMLELMLPVFRNRKVIATGGDVIVTHMAKMVHPDQKTLSAQLSPLNVKPAYDGLVVEF